MIADQQVRKLFNLVQTEMSFGIAAPKKSVMKIAFCTQIREK